MTDQRDERRADFLVFGRPDIREEDIAEVVATLESGWIGTGPRVAAFESAFASYVDAPHAVAVSSCTAALHLAMVSLDLRPGEEVLVPAMTFVATANAVVHAGGTPVLVDADPTTMCIDVDDATAKVTSRTRAVIPVHFAGRLCDTDALERLRVAHDLAVIEDCAHAIETTRDGRHAGRFGTAGAFSFYVTKNVVTAEGGMLVCDDADMAARVKTLALHGLSADAWRRFSDSGFRHYEVGEPGFKYNMTDIQAALGLGQLRRVEDNLRRRQEIWARYDTAFAALPVALPAPDAPGTRHARHLYTLVLAEDAPCTRDEVLAALQERNIGCGVHYRSVHLHRYYRERFGYRRDDLPVSAAISDRIFSIPLSSRLTDDDVEDVIRAVVAVVGGG